MNPSRRIRLLISYDGTVFSGWQRQHHDQTVQGEIESRLHRMTAEQISLHGAGRTDSGVHATGMTAHFDTTSPITCRAFKKGLNSLLPGDIRIRDAEEVSPGFHSRFSAFGKTYRYILYTGEVQPPHSRLYSLHITSPLDMTAINRCLNALVGTFDFSSFENSGSRDKNYHSGRGAVRTIFRAETMQEHDSHRLTFIFTGDGFLKNMVRNLVGTLIEVGRGKISVDDFEKILAKRDRSVAGPTAPAHGLFLEEVIYHPIPHGEGR
jgi:tRNA pseudouridine38-40 synthase